MPGPENWLGINLGDIMAQSEGIRASQQNRQFNQFRMQHIQQQDVDEQAKRDAYRQLFSPTADGSPAPGGFNPEGIAALGAVDPEAAFRVKDHLSKLSADQREMEGKKYGALAPLVLRAQKMPYQARRGFIAAAAPYLQSQGWTPDEIAAFDPTDENVQALGAAAMTVPQVLDSMKTEWHQIGEQGSFATDNMGNPVGSGNPFAGSAVGPQGGGDLFDSLIQQESGGRPGVTGPKTPYGQAQGMTQMLPATAQGMAQKLGMQWQPQMMTGTTPEAAQYQQALGKAYLDEGLQKYGGDPRKALMYYHGGPDERLWGPKTHAYADQVMARAGGMPTGAAPGFIPGVQKPREAPSGYRWSKDGNLEAIPHGPADKAGGGNFQVLSDGEAQQLGLPPGKWQRGPDGKIDQIGSNSGLGGATRQQIGLAKMKIANLRGIENQVNRVEAAMGEVEKNGWTGFISGHVPGALDKESNTFDKAVSQLAPLIRQLTRVPGEGSMSDYESRLAEMTLPSRTDTHAGRVEALAGIRALIGEIRSGYQEMLGVSDPAANAPKGGGSVDDILAKYGVK